MYKDHDDEEGEGYVSPTERLEHNFENFVEHFNGHCGQLEEVFDRVERLEKNQFKSVLMICGIISAVVFVFMLGYMAKSNQFNESRIDKLEHFDFKKGN